MKSAPPRRKPSPNARSVLASNLVALSRLKGLSQDALALDAGLHRTFVAHVEGGIRNISLDNIEKLALALDLQTYELLVPNAFALVE